jgi:hypothetical protein
MGFVSRLAPKAHAEINTHVFFNLQEFHRRGDARNRAHSFTLADKG